MSWEMYNVFPFICGVGVACSRVLSASGRGFTQPFPQIVREIRYLPMQNGKEKEIVMRSRAIFPKVSFTVGKIILTPTNTRKSTLECANMFTNLAPPKVHSSVQRSLQ